MQFVWLGHENTRPYWRQMRLHSLKRRLLGCRNFLLVVGQEGEPEDIFEDVEAFDEPEVSHGPVTHTIRPGNSSACKSNALKASNGGKRFCPHATRLGTEDHGY